MSSSTDNAASKTPLPQPAGATTITARHYQAVCGLALAAIFLVQLQQSSLAMPITLLANLLMIFIGTLGILYRVRLSPIFTFLALAFPLLMERYHADQLFGADFRNVRFLDVADVLLCIAMLTYLIGQYRLHGLWFGLLPSDARLKTETQARSQTSLSAAELAGLIFPIPVCALLAQFAVLALKQNWNLVELTPRWRQFLVAVWAILLIMFLAAHAFRYWRRLHMDRVSALLLLQDMLWHETRGEQRRIQRWSAWRKLQQKKQSADGGAK